LPTAAALVVTAVLSPRVARRVGVKLTVAAALASIAGGLLQIASTYSYTTTYEDVLPGLLLIGIGAGLLLPTATNSVVGSVPQGDSGTGSAIHAVALQTGGALGVAVIGSVAATRYKDHMTAALSGRHLPATVSNTIMGSIGGALGVAHNVGGDVGWELAAAARFAFMSGLGISFFSWRRSRWHRDAVCARATAVLGVRHFL
jgi:hypothetical protein